VVSPLFPGRPPAKKKPVVQPVIVSKGKLPESWEGPNGSVILVDKPLEWSSHQACSRLKFQLKLKKVSTYAALLWELGARNCGCGYFEKDSTRSANDVGRPRSK
jgi:hypothetical protein